MTELSADRARSTWLRRSSKPAAVYNYDTFAADLKTVLTTLELTNVALVGFSMGGGEVTRYIAKCGTHRVRKAANCRNEAPASRPPFARRVQERLDWFSDESLYGSDGQTADSRENPFNGSSDPPLTMVGEAMVQAFAEAYASLTQIPYADLRKAKDAGGSGEGR